MKISLLTSSRADYGIYLPLLKQLNENKQFKLRIIAFGTHLSPFHGLTIDNILSDGFKVAHSIESMVAADSAEAIATAMALTTMKFASLWAELSKKTDLIICLGDRYEMFAAVSASIPFNIPVAHLYGGETTLGAIDNKFRHALTQMATYHFTATEQYAQTVAALTNNSPFIYNVGALSLDNLENIHLLTAEEFKRVYDIDMRKKTMLITFHPETVSAELNYKYVRELISALDKINYQIVITMPNADTMGNKIRTELLLFARKKPRQVFTIENFGTQGYFSCMALCSFLLGNTSSGIIEAASFGKYVINIGNRQKGRACSNNVLHSPLRSKDLLDTLKHAEQLPPYSGGNIYHHGNASQKIISILQSLPITTTS